MTKRYIRRPYTVETIVWDGTNMEEIKNFAATDDVKHASLVVGDKLLLCIRNYSQTIFLPLHDILAKDRNGELTVWTKEKLDNNFEEIVK